MLRRMTTRWVAFWVGPIDPIRLETFRVALGLSLLVYLAAWWRHAEEWLTPMGFHLSARAFTLAPLAPLLPVWALPWLGTVLFGSVAALIVGWNTRWAVGIALSGVTYVTLVDPLAAFTLNKLFIVSLAVLALVPMGSYWSLDRRAPRLQSAWPLRVLQATIILQFFTAGWCKVAHGDWLRDPYVLWTQVQGVYRTPFAEWLLTVLPLGVWSWMQYASLTFELLAPLLFMVKRLRPIGFTWGFGFLLMITLTMHMLVFFTLQLVCFGVLFMDDRLLHGLRMCLHQLVLQDNTRWSPMEIRTPNTTVFSERTAAAGGAERSQRRD